MKIEGPIWVAEGPFAAASGPFLVDERALTAVVGPRSSVDGPFPDVRGHSPAKSGPFASETLHRARGRAREGEGKGSRLMVAKQSGLSDERATRPQGTLQTAAHATLAAAPRTTSNSRFAEPCPSLTRGDSSFAPSRVTERTPRPAPLELSTTT